MRWLRNSSRRFQGDNDMNSCYSCGTSMTWVHKRRLFWCPTCKRCQPEAPSTDSIANACRLIQSGWSETTEIARSGGARAPHEVTREKRVQDGLVRRGRRRHE